MVDKRPAGVYNIPCQQRTARLTQPNIGDLHSGSAVDSDSTCGSSILSSPTRKPQSQLAAVFSGHSAVGSAPRSGRGGRGFKSRCSDQKRPVHIRVLVFFYPRKGVKAGRLEMASACALAIFRGNIFIMICSAETPAGVSALLFHARESIALYK